MTGGMIVVTLCRRPDYTQQMLAALAQCYGLDNYRVLFSVDWYEAHSQECNVV